MEMMIDIFKQLGANESLLPQFIIVVVMFYLTKFLFLDHLQSILDTREDKTTKLDGQADKKFEEITKSQNDYKAKIQETNKSLKAKSDSEKAEFSKGQEVKYKEKENEINSFVEASRKDIEKEIAGKKATVMSEAELLADTLVQRISKES